MKWYCEGFTVLNLKELLFNKYLSKAEVGAAHQDMNTPSETFESRFWMEFPSGAKMLLKT